MTKQEFKKARSESRKLARKTKYTREATTTICEKATIEQIVRKLQPYTFDMFTARMPDPFQAAIARWE